MIMRGNNSQTLLKCGPLWVNTKKMNLSVLHIIKNDLILLLFFH